MARDQPPRAALFGTAVVVLVMGLSTAASVEAWPLGPWELFSRSRKPVQTSFIAKSVLSDGVERQIDFGSLPYQYGGAHAVLGRFMRLSGGEQNAVCEAWSTALERAGKTPDQILIYRLERRPTLDGRPPQRREELVHRCPRRPPR